MWLCTHLADCSPWSNQHSGRSSSWRIQNRRRWACRWREWHPNSPGRCCKTWDQRRSAAMGTVQSRCYDDAHTRPTWRRYAAESTADSTTETACTEGSRRTKTARSEVRNNGSDVWVGPNSVWKYANVMLTIFRRGLGPPAGTSLASTGARDGHAHNILCNA